MPTPQALFQLIRRIEAWMTSQHPERMPFFRPGANVHDLHRVEAKLGCALPDEVRLLYAAHDGQPEGAPNLYLNQRWLPLDCAAVAWEDLRLRHGDYSVSSARRGEGSVASLRDGMWSENWLPLFGSWRGDHYCLDLRPGCYGQIIWFLYDQPERAVIADSLKQMLVRVADGLENGQWHLGAGLDGLSD